MTGMPGIAGQVLLNPIVPPSWQVPLGRSEFPSAFSFALAVLVFSSASDGERYGFLASLGCRGIYLTLVTPTWSEAASPEIQMCISMTKLLLELAIQPQIELILHVGTHALKAEACFPMFVIPHDRSGCTYV